MANNAQAALSRVLNDPKYAGRPKDVYIQSIEITPVAASAAAATGQTQIADDGDFIAVYIVASLFLAADHTTVVAYPAWPLLVTIKDSGAGRDFMDKAVALPSLAGNAQLPMVLPWPKYVERASTLTATAQNLAATAYDLRISLVGVKLFGR